MPLRRRIDCGRRRVVFILNEEQRWRVGVTGPRAVARPGVACNRTVKHLRRRRWRAFLVGNIARHIAFVHALAADHSHPLTPPNEALRRLTLMWRQVCAVQNRLPDPVSAFPGVAEVARCVAEGVLLLVATAKWDTTCGEVWRQLSGTFAGGHAERSGNGKVTGALGNRRRRSTYPIGLAVSWAETDLSMARRDGRMARTRMGGSSRDGWW